MKNVFFRRFSMGALVAFILLMIGNDLLFQNIAMIMDTEEAFYEVVSQNGNSSMKIDDLNKLKETLKTEILVMGEKNTQMSVEGKEYNVLAKGVFGDYKSFFPVRLKKGSFVTDISLDTKKPMVIEQKLSQKIFKNKDTIGLNFSEGNKVYEIVGILEKSLFSLFIPERNVVYMPLDALKDKKLKVPITSIYIGSKDHENKEISEGNVESALAQYGINDVVITKGTKKIDSIRTIQACMLLFLVLVMTKDIMKILQRRWKKLYCKLNEAIRLTDKGMFTKENMYTLLKEVMIGLMSVGLLIYLFYRIPIVYLPVKGIMKEEVITLTYYLNNIKEAFSESFTNRNAYITPLGYILKGIYQMIVISFVISLIPLYIYRKYKVIENSFLKESLSLISIVFLLIFVNIKASFVFMLNKELFIVLSTFIFTQNMKVYLEKEEVK
ncbi:ABC transporter permease [Crassaminicella profunda]|uniref:ABC transporter permease n=1 Tax=Crassaminicella profunda TaxID=1286698 RepID=UPI001CA6F2FF|nr:ABC transporter permease [Crassaminicella profunda]QZY54117.1 ABC transporter permease [Crassaminicella profunda]